MFTVKTGQTSPGKLLVVAIVVLVAVTAALPAGATGDGDDDSGFRSPNATASATTSPRL